MKVTFSVNRYDREGDSIDNCILLHIDNKTILRFDDLLELNKFIGNLEKIKLEIEENY